MKIFWFVITLAFGALFLYSGIVKLKDPITFADTVRNYRIIGDPIAPAVALFLPWLEVIAGIALMTGKFAKGGAFILLSAMVFFTAAIGLSWIRGLDITCGCFGDNEIVNYPVKMTQNVILVAVGFAIWWKLEMSGDPKSRLETEAGT